MARKSGASRSKTKASAGEVGKRIRFDRETWNAIEVLARDQMKDIQEISEEAFRDLLKKYGRSADFREALKLSARQAKANDNARKNSSKR